jgi:hypothetical protein
MSGPAPPKKRGPRLPQSKAGRECTKHRQHSTSKPGRKARACPRCGVPAPMLPAQRMCGLCMGAVLWTR